MVEYNFKEIESKWQKYWKDNNVYKVDDELSKPKYYILDMFPYPSGAGLHIGHPEGYTASDIISRYKRMKGYNVLHPMGFDAFGLPTERYSMQTGIHPTIATEKNISNFIRQMNTIGFDYDWERMINTTSPQYYKWTQWMFAIIYNSWYDHHQKKARHINELPIPSYIETEKEIEEYKDSKRLAYIANIPVNWCQELGTVLANEEVDEWKEKGYTVERKPMRQWMLRITEYADRLLEDLELVDWPHSTKEMQINWIGKSIGAEIIFDIDKSSCQSNEIDSTQSKNNKLGTDLLTNLIVQKTDDHNEKANETITKWKTEIKSNSLVEKIEHNFDEKNKVLNKWRIDNINENLDAINEHLDFVSEDIDNINEKANNKLDSIKVFTTRPDTIFGATYIVLAPEHPLVAKITTQQQKPLIDKYVAESALKSDLDRTALNKVKTGVFTGGYAINPANKERIPIWIADYVLAHYGTGAIMAVPAHDERDYEFAKQFGLEIKQVVKL